MPSLFNCLFFQTLTNVLSNQVNVISTVTTQMVAITAAANRDSNLTRTSERV